MITRLSLSLFLNIELNNESDAKWKGAHCGSETRGSSNELIILYMLEHGPYISPSSFSLLLSFPRILVTNFSA